MAEPLSSQRQQLLEQLLKLRRGEKVNKTIPRHGRTTAPLSYTQEGLWLLCQIEPDSPFYNVGTAFIFHGQIDIAALEASLSSVVDRHTALRTSFSEVNGAPVQSIIEHQKPSFAVASLRANGGRPHSSESLQALARGEMNGLFDLKHGDVLRSRLFMIDADTSMLVVTAHHLVFDAWSTSILMEEVVHCYSAFHQQKRPSLPELPIQYVDFAIWQRSTLSSEALNEQLENRAKALSGCPPLELPCDYEASRVSSYYGATTTFRIEEDMLRQLRDIGRESEATLFMVLLTAFVVQLHLYTGETDIAVGSPISGRYREEFESVIGFFANTLVLRNDLSGDPTLRQALHRVRKSTVETFAHQAVPFKSLVERVAPERKSGRTPLFQVLFSMYSVPPLLPVLPDLRVEQLNVDQGTTKFDLSVDLLETANGMDGTIEYSTEIFSAGSISRVIEHYHSILKQFLIQPDDRISAFDLFDDHTASLIRTLKSQADFDFDLSRQDRSISTVVA